MPRLVSLLTGSGMRAGPGCLRNCAPTGALVTARNHFRFSSFSRQTASSMTCEPATAPTASKLAGTPAVCKPCSGRPSLLGSTTPSRSQRSLSSKVQGGRPWLRCAHSSPAKHNPLCQVAGRLGFKKWVVRPEGDIKPCFFVEPPTRTLRHFASNCV